MARLIPRYPAHELARMCELFFPEERRHEFTSEPWDGVSFRHYRDPKIVCIEHFMPQSKSIPPGATTKPSQKPAA
jgi:hypothetical protein